MRKTTAVGRGESVESHAHRSNAGEERPAPRPLHDERFRFGAVEPGRRQPPDPSWPVGGPRTAPSPNGPVLERSSSKARARRIGTSAGSRSRQEDRLRPTDRDRGAGEDASARESSRDSRLRQRNRPSAAKASAFGARDGGRILPPHGRPRRGATARCRPCESLAAASVGRVCDLCPECSPAGLGRKADPTARRASLGITGDRRETAGRCYAARWRTRRGEILPPVAGSYGAEQFPVGLPAPAGWEAPPCAAGSFGVTGDRRDPGGVATMESAHATTVKFSRPWPAPRGAMAICGVAGFGRMGGPTVRHRVVRNHGVRGDIPSRCYGTKRRA